MASTLTTTTAALLALRDAAGKSTVHPGTYPPRTAASVPTTATATAGAARVPSRAVVGALESAVVREQIRLQLPRTPRATSSDEASVESSPPPPTLAREPEVRANAGGEKKRKPTYYVRKDEMAHLQSEIAVLQARLAASEAHSGRGARSLLAEVMGHNAELQRYVRHGGLAIASTQSLVASYGFQCRSPPIGGFIHLTKDPTERQRALSALKLPRLQEAISYVLTRCQFLDATKTSRQVETFETDAGDLVTTHWEITPLEAARSVVHAYRELQYFIETQEISMSEKLGVLTIRESESDPVDGAQVVRLLSTHENGLQSETNLATFSQYFESSDMLQRPHALLVVDFVDQDDLYPRQPRTRIRKDVASATMITQVPGVLNADGRPLVTMVRIAFVRVNQSPYTKSRDLEYIAREGVARWCDVMLRCVRERLAWKA